MRRAIPVLLATLGGLALLAAFHTTPEPSKLTSPKSSTSTPAAGAGGTPPGSAGGSGRVTTTLGSAVRTYTGSVEQNPYGPVQVRVTLRGSSLADITALQLPSDRAHSQRLSEEAGPILRSEALQAQSARIDIVSGATFTSEGYAQSLQSALDQAGFGG